MKHFVSISTTLALTLSLAASAFAQPAESVAATTPADGEEDVSTLNGQLVKVGDQNRYQHAYKKFNVSTNPLGIIVGSYGVSVSYAAHERVALRGDINYYDPIGGEVHGVEFGVGAPIYFRKMYSGLFLEPGAMISSISTDDGDASATVFGPQVLIGYHWYWDSGLNVALAAGMGRNWNSNSDEDKFEDYDKVFANGYLRFGYAF